MNNKEIIGYIGGVFDLFHVGHINILRNCKSRCDKLIVGVTTDKLMIYKQKKAVIPYQERAEIVRCCKFVDCVVSQNIIDKVEIQKRLKYNILFVGDDWFKSESWEEYERKLKEAGVNIIYFPYTKGTTSTLINETLISLRSAFHKWRISIEPNLKDEFRIRVETKKTVYNTNKKSINEAIKWAKEFIK